MCIRDRTTPGRALPSPSGLRHHAHDTPCGPVVRAVIRNARSVSYTHLTLPTSTERHLHSDPPTADQVEAARADVRAALDVVEETVDLTGIGAVVGLAGSITTITAHALGLSAYDPTRIHLARIPVDRHREACRSLLAMSHTERAALGFMHPGRVDVIGGGALVWHEVLDRVVGRSPAAAVVTSEHDILDGIALSLV